MYTNVDGISNKDVLFSRRVEVNKPHIIFVTETKLMPDVETFTAFQIQNYTPFRKDRVTDGGGGIIMFVSDLFCTEEVIIDSLVDIEVIICKITMGSNSLIVACVYRPPSSSRYYNSKISEAINKISEISADQYLIFGDLTIQRLTEQTIL